MLLKVLFIVSILAGQTIKIPVSGNLGPTLLDAFIMLFIIYGVLKLKFKLKNPPPFIKAALIFCGISALSLIFTPLNLSPQEYLISFSYTLRLLMYIGAAWLIYSGASDGFKKSLGSSLLISGVGLGMVGLLQFFFLPDLIFLQPLGWDPHYFRAVSTFLDPNFFGAFLVLSMLLGVFLLLKGKKTHRYFYFIFGVLYFALLLTFSRSSYLMFLLSGLSLSFLRKSRLLFLVTILLFFTLMLGFQLYSYSVAQPRNIDRGQSAQSRITTWQQGLELFQKSPVLGIGFNSYRYALRQYSLGDQTFISSNGSSSNDSSLLYVLATTGIFGFLSYLVFLLMLAKSSAQNILLKASLAGLIIHSVFANSLFYPPVFIWVLFSALIPKK